MSHHRMTRSRSRLTCGVFLLALAAIVASGPAARAQTPAPAASLDKILEELSSYSGGIDSAAFWKLRDYVLARKDDPAGRAECELKLLRFLKTSATPVSRMAACRYLREIGSDTAVPALASMLSDERAADMALYALQQIPGRTVDDALVQALSKVSGPTRIAIIAALGERKSAETVPALVPLLGRAELAGAAAVALGAIGDDASATALVAAYAGARSDLKPAIAASMMKCAENRLAAGGEAAALRLYEILSADATLPVPLRRAAAMGRMSAAGNGAAAILMNQLAGSDTVMQEAAITKISDVIRPDAVAPVCAVLPRLPDGARVQLLAVLAGYPADAVLPAILESARSSSLPVRLAALEALESTGGPSVVPLLVERAASARGQEQTAARRALGMLKGRAVDAAILTLLSRPPSDIVQGELLLAAAGRQIFSAKHVVAASLTASSPRIRVQALRALRVIGTPSDIPAVLDLLLKSADDSERTEAEATTAALAQKTAEADRRSSVVKARLAAGRKPEQQARLIGVLALIGDSSALPILRTALRDSNSDVFDAAVRALAAWPTSAARDDVLRLARDSRNETHRLLAIAGLVRSVGLDKYRDPEAAVADLEQAAGFSWRPEEQRLVLAALVQFPCREALDLAWSFLREPAVEAEAWAAIHEITTRLARDPARR